MVIFAANRRSSGERINAVVNAEETEWLVWNMATYDLREAANISAMGVPKGEDEFQHAGFKAQSCISAPDPSFLETHCTF